MRGPRVPGAAVEIWYLNPRGRLERLFDPYTGANLGDAVACEPAFVSGLADLHDDLMGGSRGRDLNGIGAALILVMCLSGAVIWWRGAARWWRGAMLRRNVHGQRFVRDLHGVVGFWVFALLLLWASSALYFAFPNAITELGYFLVSHSGGHLTNETIDDFTAGFAMLHFGRAFGPWVKLLWVILGLAPVALFVTGALMWWNRVLRPAPGST